MSQHCYEIFAQIAEKMSAFGNVDVKQCTSKRVLVAVANHGRLVFFSNSFVFVTDVFHYITHTNYERKDDKRFLLHELYMYIRNAVSYIEKAIAANCVRFRDICEIS